MKFKNTLALAAIASLALATAAFGGSHEKTHAASSMDIVEFAAHTGDFDTLLQALEVAGLTESLKGDASFTVFAPTDAAFAKIPQADLEGLLADKEKLTAVLTYHVVPGRVTAEQVAGLDSAKTLQGQSVTFDTENGVHVDSAKVVKADVLVSNGVIHVIDTVISPKL
jgi:uncharacterized surface protein with fasciclin (FAS1) repeats